MLEKLTRASFEEHTGATFRLQVDASNALDLELVEAVGMGGTPAARDPFAVLFRGPKEPVLEQRIYTLESDAMGSLDLFLVPVGPDRDGLLYEAVFT